MRHRHRKVYGLSSCKLPDLYGNPPLLKRRIVIIGAGTFLNSIIQTIRQHESFELVGILDPTTTLKGQHINGLPVLGWLENIPHDITCAAIGNSATPSGFDREAVYRIIRRKSIDLPILQSLDAICADDVTLHTGTLLLEHCRIEKGSSVGENTLIGNHATIQAYTPVPAHSVIYPNTEHGGQTTFPSSTIEPRSLAAVLSKADESIQEIIHRINWANMEIILVVDSNGALIGTITDGDIRRGILAGVDTSQPTSLIMNPSPTAVPLGTSHSDMLEIMKKQSIRHLPVVDNKYRPIRLERMESLVEHFTGHDAIVMAGGLGSRLRPLTNTTPKPLLDVGGKPILDHILTGLQNSGIEDVVISVNYMGEQIREHVGNGNNHQLSVNYVSEKERLGTAGALSLLQPKPKRPFLVMNGDLLTRMNYDRLYQFQKEHNHTLVMCVRKHHIQVPYGVVDIENGLVTGLREKPTYDQFINAGIYILTPECLNYIPQNQYFDMTNLIDVILENGGSVGAFPIIEYWRDIGNPDDLQAAGKEQALYEHNNHTKQEYPEIPMEHLVVRR